MCEKTWGDPKTAAAVLVTDMLCPDNVVGTTVFYVKGNHATASLATSLSVLAGTPVSTALDVHLLRLSD